MLSKATHYPSSSYPVFPREIFDLVIDEIALEEYRNEKLRSRDLNSCHAYGQKDIDHPLLPNILSVLKNVDRLEVAFQSPPIVIVTIVFTDSNCIIRQANFQLAQQIANNNRNTLTMLAFPDGIVLEDIKKYNINVLPHLRHVKSTVWGNEYRDPFAALKRLLTNVTAPNNVLEKITLKLSNFHYFLDKWTKKSFWDALDKFLSNRKQFPNLRMVELHERPHPYYILQVNIIEREKAKLRSILGGRMEERGLLVLKSYRDRTAHLFE
ncbi:hypothetical protein BDQ17DRAFT_1513580 [Cyathus striatus]|nr:hypothetical protein BDQ17DRAFT_1513580 [Cyathus striatus]